MAVPPPEPLICDLCLKHSWTVRYCGKCRHFLCEECRNDYPKRIAAFTRQRIFRQNIPNAQPPPADSKDGCLGCEQNKRRGIFERFHRRI